LLRPGFLGGELPLGLAQLRNEPYKVKPLERIHGKANAMAIGGFNVQVINVARRRKHVPNEDVPIVGALLKVYLADVGSAKLQLLLVAIDRKDVVVECNVRIFRDGQGRSHRI